VAEFEEWAAMPGAEQLGLEMRNMPELETSVVAEPTLAAEPTEILWLEMWDMSELNAKLPLLNLNPKPLWAK